MCQSNAILTNHNLRDCDSWDTHNSWTTKTVQDHRHGPGKCIVLPPTCINSQTFQTNVLKAEISNCSVNNLEEKESATELPGELYSK